MQHDEYLRKSNASTGLGNRFYIIDDIAPTHKDNSVNFFKFCNTHLVVLEESVKTMKTCGKKTK